MARSRDSLISDNTTTTYPSTTSSFDRSILGLTDSPIHPQRQTRTSMLAQIYSNSSSDQSLPATSPWHRRKSQTQNAAGRPHRDQEIPPAVPNKVQHVRTKKSSDGLRASQSQPTLHATIQESSPTTYAPPSPWKQREQQTARKQRTAATAPIQLKPQAGVMKRAQSSESIVTHQRPTTPMKLSQPRASTVSPTKQVRTSASKASLNNEVTPTKPAVRTKQPGAATHRAIAIPQRPIGNIAADPSSSPARRKQVELKAKTPRKVSVAPTEDTMAQDWESELIQNAKNLRVSEPKAKVDRPASSAGAVADSRQKDADWERSGMWGSQLDAAREAEDRTRREAGREIAYPPVQPRVPIRAAPTGVTSVHIGIRPRIHPSRANESSQRNQPDADIPPPLFSPSHASQHLDGEVRGSYNSRYSTDLLEKAKAEYEVWLSRREEREGGIGYDGGGGGDWGSRSRSVAIPRQTLPREEGWDEPRRSAASSSGNSGKVQTPMDGQFDWNAYGYPNQQSVGGANQFADTGQAGVSTSDASPLHQQAGWPDLEGLNTDVGAMQGGQMWTQEDWANYYAQMQQYWNPQYWWGQGYNPNQYGMPPQESAEGPPGARQETTSQSTFRPIPRQI